MLLERVGYDVSAVGGPSYCCGTTYDSQLHAASNMASRTVGRFNEAAEKDGRGKVVTWCPSCHMHMSDIMSPGNSAAFEIAHITELLAERADRLAPLLTVPVERRVFLHRHLGFATHVPVNDRVSGLLARIPGLQLVQGRAASRPYVQRASGASRARSPRPRARPGRRPRRRGATRFAPYFTPATASWRRSTARKELACATGCISSAEGMGLEASDAYLGWRTGGAPDIAATRKGRRTALPSARRARAPQTAPAYRRPPRVSRKRAPRSD